jgi:hypothetical protein
MTIAFIVKERLDALTYSAWRRRRVQRACRMLITETLANRGHEHPAERAIAAVTAKYGAKYGAETLILAIEMLEAFVEAQRPA